MHEKHINQLSLPQASDHKAKRTEKKQTKKHENKKQCKIRLNVKRPSKFHKATQNKNNSRTTALERSVA